LSAKREGRHVRFGKPSLVAHKKRGESHGVSCDERGEGELSQGITLAEFKEVYRLRPRLHDMTVALNTYGGAMGSISKADFERAARKICDVKLTPVQVRAGNNYDCGCEATSCE